VTTATPPAPQTRPLPFSRYQKVVVGLLAFLQFAVILDFMIMAPLGAVIMPALSMSASQFGLVVSAYAFSAGAAGCSPPVLQTATTASRCCCSSTPASFWVRCGAGWHKVSRPC
jgi:hypothetical protein